MTKYFIDTNELIRGITKTEQSSIELLNDDTKKKIINKFVIKEIRWTLRNKFNFSYYDIELAIEKLYVKCQVVSNPPKNRFRKLNIKDKGDKTIVQSAMDHNCILVTNDYDTYHDAKRYVETKTAEEVYEKKK